MNAIVSKTTLFAAALALAFALTLATALPSLAQSIDNTTISQGWCSGHGGHGGYGGHRGW